MKISEIQANRGTDVHQKALEKFHSELAKIYPARLLDYYMGHESLDHRGGLDSVSKPVDARMDPRVFLTLLGHLEKFANASGRLRGNEKNVEHLNRIAFLANVAVKAEKDPDAALMMKLAGE